MEKLIQEVLNCAARADAEIIDLVAVLAGCGSQRRFAELVRVAGLADQAKAVAVIMIIVPASRWHHTLMAI